MYEYAGKCVYMLMYNYMYVHVHTCDLYACMNICRPRLLMLKNLAYTFAF